MPQLATRPPDLDADGQPVGVSTSAPAETTALSAADERAFQAWVQRNKITDVDAPDSHYDYRGYYKEYGNKPIRFGVDHFTDTYKQHGHPTFSVESKYSKGAADGGRWQGEKFIPSSAPAAKPPDLDANGQPVFTSSNEKDEAGNPIVDFASSLWETVNPLNTVKGLYQQLRHPVDSANAKLKYEAEHPILAGLASSPLGQFGGVPAGARIARGDVAGGLGEAAGDVINAALPAMGDAVGGAVKGFVNRPRFVNPNAVERAAVQFVAARGVPIDAGTVTGNRFVRSVQGLADHSPIGSVIAERGKASTNEGLTRLGGELAADVHPSPATPESAGAAVQGETASLIKNFDQQANEAYGKLRAIEAQHEQTVPKQEAASVQRDIHARAAASVGQTPTAAEWQELRRIHAEMDALPFVKRTWNWRDSDVGVKGNAAGGHADIVRGAAGAPVYDDIMQAAPGTSSMTRAEVTRSIKGALDSGHFTNAAKGALEVAKQRLAGSPSVSKPSLPPEAGNPRITQEMLLPVDLRSTKADIQPIYARLKREAELVPLQGDKARALTALDRLTNGPDYAPVSVVDAALSDLKAMARGAFMPELRTAGQGLAAHTVAKLDAAVRSAVAKAGPEATAALQQGRQATMAKHAVGEVLESLNTEPVKAFRQATAPKDTAIASLRQLSEIAPNAMPQVGRAVLEELLTTATAEGGFSKTKGLQAKWQQLGPQTKQILFGDNAANLDRFFLLAKKIEESPNPSQTALTLSSGSQLALAFTHPLTGVPLVLGSGALSKILHSAAATRYLTHGMMLAEGPGRFSQAARAVAVTNLLTAAREAGVRLPQAAQNSPSGDQSLPPGTGR